MVTLMPRVSSSAAKEAAAMPLPKEDTTPPVTKTYLVMKDYIGSFNNVEIMQYAESERKNHSLQAKLYTLMETD